MARTLPLALAAIVLPLIAASIPPSEASERDHKLLKIDGLKVRWQGGDRAQVSYAFLDGGTMRGKRNCRLMKPISAVVRDSNVDRKTMRRAARRAFDRW